MEKTSVQLELFSKAKEGLETKTTRTHPILGYIRLYEKTILIIITLLITGLVSFSLGVEKGKRLAVSQENLRLDLASTPQPNLLEVQPQKQEIIKPRQNQISEIYTIQVASYKTKSYAQKEAALLKKKGLSALVLSKGAYSILCVGNFSDKQAAKTVLGELKKKYVDCYIRRL